MMQILNNTLCWLSRFKDVLYVVSVMVSIGLFIVAVRACSNAQKANRIATEALKQSNQFNAITAEVQLDQLVKSYREVDDQLRTWEQSAQIKRDKDKDVPAKTREELDTQLQQFQAPENIKVLYLLRFERYQSLLNVSKQYEPFKDRLKYVNSALPVPPRLPVRIELKANIRGTSSTSEVEVQVKPDE